MIFNIVRKGIDKNGRNCDNFVSEQAKMRFFVKPFLRKIYRKSLKAEMFEGKICPGIFRSFCIFKGGPRLKKEEEKPPVLTIVLIVLLAAALVVIFVLMGKGDKEPQKPIEITPTVIGGGEPIPEAQNIPKDVGNTHLPAYGGLTFTAGTKEQETVLQNPGENSCLIRISLILADGTTIYTSELVKPGYYTKPIMLIAPMERGIYRDVTMKYECFTDDEAQTPLNGATTKLDITVN